MTASPAHSFGAWFLSEDGVQKWVFYLPVIFLVLFFALPLSLTYVWSVFERTQFWMEPGFTLFSYINFFTSARLENFLFSMYHSAIAVVIAFILGFPIAVFVRRRITEVAQHRVILLFILPFMVSEIIRIFALRPVLQRNGFVNTVLINIGVIDEPITAILYSPTGVIIGEVLSFLPFIVFAGFLAMEAVPKYVFEICQDLSGSRCWSLANFCRYYSTPGSPRYLRRLSVYFRQWAWGGSAAKYSWRAGRRQCWFDSNPGHRGS